MSVQELENAIRHLSPGDFAQLARWIDEYRADQWDQQIEADIRAGRLDEAGCRADVDFDACAAPRYKPLRDARVLVSRSERILTPVKLQQS